MLTNRFTPVAPAVLPKPAVTPNQREGGTFDFPKFTQHAFEDAARRIFIPSPDPLSKPIEDPLNRTRILDYVANLTIQNFIRLYPLKNGKIEQKVNRNSFASSQVIHLYSDGYKTNEPYLKLEIVPAHSNRRSNGNDILASGVRGDGHNSDSAIQYIDRKTIDMLDVFGIQGKTNGNDIFERPNYSGERYVYRDYPLFSE
jgi:hypothetical protein